MFLKIATLLAILGLLMSLLLSLIQQALVVGGFYNSGMLLVYRILTVSESLLLTVPLLIFFVAFFLSLKTIAPAVKTGSVNSRETL